MDDEALWEDEREDVTIPERTIISMSIDIVTLAKYYFTNENDRETEIECLKKVKPIKGYEDFEDIGIHGSEENVICYLDDGTQLTITPQELAEMLKNEKESGYGNYKGGNIRLLSCNTGSLDDGVAQQLADILQVDVLAPTETLSVDQNGRTLITNDRYLIRKWSRGENVNDTGEWKLFTYKERSGSND